MNLDIYLSVVQNYTDYLFLALKMLVRVWTKSYVISPRIGFGQIGFVQYIIMIGNWDTFVFFV